MPLSRHARIGLVALVPFAAAACVAAILSIPPDERLGTMVRFVMFHGASTWVNMGTFTLAGAFSLAYVFGAEKLGRWGEAFRWCSLPLWCVNTVLGITSMKLIWGGILWNEPRLGMTFGLLAAAVVILAIQLIFDHPKVPAVLDAVLAISLWTLVLVLPNLFHPDSPVFNSENPTYIYSFLAMVASMAVAAGCVVTLVARRRHPEHPHGHALP
ncbi:MAG: hypothetical protein EG823_07125 [Actinobacteria bacterium]|nr:hypothetical protein [Actinomycetota bacterium]